jgi:beta-glucosidase
MTVEEKVALTLGKDFWHTQAIERLGIPSIAMNDGPHGVRKPKSGEEIGIGGSIPATCFPTASALAASWDTGLLNEVGQALGDECLALDVQVLLGPGLNIKRTPLCGRNFEYFSEDPVLSGELATAHVRGVQSRGIGTSVKHYACNNQEYERNTINVEVDSRTLHEIYLSGFERVVRQAEPWTVMGAYNRVDGLFACENPYLLREMLKQAWGFQGVVVSDWGAVNDKTQALLAGLDLEMPGGWRQPKIVELIKSGEIPEPVIDEAVNRLLRMILTGVANRKPGSSVNWDEHNALARRAAAESMVLLKNHDNILPLRTGSIKTVAVLGRFAKQHRFQGGGSSHIVPTKVETAYDELARLLDGKAEIKYADGYPEEDRVDEAVLQEAAKLAQSSDVALIFAGLPESYESEGFDRKHINMPPSHNRLIEEVCRAQPQTVVVLANGSAVSMPWVAAPKAIL